MANLADRVLHAIYFLKEIARRPGEPVKPEGMFLPPAFIVDKINVQTIQKLRIAMFVKPEKRMSHHHRFAIAWLS